METVKFKIFNKKNYKKFLLKNKENYKSDYTYFLDRGIQISIFDPNEKFLYNFAKEFNAHLSQSRGTDYNKTEFIYEPITTRRGEFLGYRLRKGFNVDFTPDLLFKGWGNYDFNFNKKVLNET